METTAIYSALGTLLVFLGVLSGIRHFDLKRIEESRAECEKRRYRYIDPVITTVKELEKGMAPHHEDGDKHRDLSREDSMFRRLEDKIESNKETVLTQQKTVDSRLGGLQTMLENILREIRYNNGTTRK